MNKPLTLLLALLTSASFISGCTSSKARVFGKDMPSMKEIHDQKFGGEKIVKTDSRIRGRKVTDADEEHDSDFVWLPNPTLHMYVFKHFTAAGNPVPGYTTFFKMYERDTLALPSEVEGWE